MRKNFQSHVGQSVAWISFWLDFLVILVTMLDKKYILGVLKQEAGIIKIFTPFHLTKPMDHNQVFKPNHAESLCPRSSPLKLISGNFQHS
jgi:hypothetical protein